MCEDNSEQFSLRWNNFFSNLTSGFHSLWQGEDFVDVTLAADGKFIQAHKVVLSVCSPYFMHLFKVNPCQHPIVILKDVGFKELSGLLQFMYRGEVNVYQEELPNFLKTAELLQVKGLTSSESQANEKDGVDRADEKFNSKRQRQKEAASEATPKEDKPLNFQEEQKKTVSSPKHKLIISGKRKRPDLEGAGSNSPNRGEPKSPSMPLVPPVPKLEPLEFGESDCLENKTMTESLASLFEVDSSRPVTNKPGQRLIANFSTSQEPLEADQATFRVTSRGRLQLVQNNYVYHCNRQKDNKIFWKCAEYNRTGCRGRCISIGWSVTVTHALHNHQPVWSESLDESKIISDLSEMKQLFGSPRHVGIDHDHLLSTMYQRNTSSQLNEPNAVNLESF